MSRRASPGGVRSTSARSGSTATERQLRYHAAVAPRGEERHDCCVQIWVDQQRVDIRHLWPSPPVSRTGACPAEVSMMRTSGAARMAMSFSGVVAPRSDATPLLKDA